jgi:integrase
MLFIAVVVSSKLLCYTNDDQLYDLLWLANKQRFSWRRRRPPGFCQLRHPLRNRVIVLLAAKAGLRAGEIANLTWDMVLNPTGDIASVIELCDHAAKNDSGRSIPVHPDLRHALAAYRSRSPGFGPVIQSERGGPMTPLSIVVWFNRAFRNIGLNGCSSHSGRRTFITRAARLVHRVGGSLRDVQLLAGHRSIQTTQHYIDGDTDVQRKLVAMI